MLNLIRILAKFADDFHQRLTPTRLYKSTVEYD